MRLIALLLLALPAAAAPLPAGAPRLSLRLDAICGQTSTARGVHAGGGIGLGYRLGDQVSLVADLAWLAAPGGGIGSAAAGVQGTLDSTPIAPYLELAVVDFTNRKAVGYSVALRTSAGAEWKIIRAAAIGLVVRAYTPFDPEPGTDGLSGITGALRFTFTPGAM